MVNGDNGGGTVAKPALL